jgi:hypothetical protein
MTAQAAVRSIAKVADAYKAAKVNGHELEEPVRFRKHAAQPYDDRIFRFLPGVDQVSIWTLTGRIKLSFVCGDLADQPRRRIQGVRIQTSLVHSAPAPGPRRGPDTSYTNSPDNSNSIH